MSFILVLPSINKSGSTESHSSNLFRGTIEPLPDEVATSIRIYLCSNGSGGIQMTLPS